MFSVGCMKIKGESKGVCLSLTVMGAAERVVQHQLKVVFDYILRIREFFAQAYQKMLLCMWNVGRWSSK